MSITDGIKQEFMTQPIRSIGYIVAIVATIALGISNNSAFLAQLVEAIGLPIFFLASGIYSLFGIATKSKYSIDAFFSSLAFITLFGLSLMSLLGTLASSDARLFELWKNLEASEIRILLDRSPDVPEDSPDADNLAWYLDSFESISSKQQPRVDQFQNIESVMFVVYQFSSIFGLSLTAALIAHRSQPTTGS